MNKELFIIMTESYLKGFRECRELIIKAIDAEEHRAELQTEAEQTESQPQPETKPKPKQTKQKSEAKAEPKPDGRRKVDKGKIIALHNAGWKPKAIQEEMGISEATVYNVLKEYRESQESK